MAHKVFKERLDGWRNDDLLLHQSARDQLELEFKGALRVFDWEDMRGLFEKFNLKAGISRKSHQRLALFFVSLAGSGALLTTVLTGVEGANPVWWWMAALMSCTGLICTLGFSVFRGSKQEWLENRLLTERLRQFYFQFMISDPALAAEAMHDESAFQKWQEKKVLAFKYFKAWSECNLSTAMKSVMLDSNNKQLWQLSEWRVSPALPKESKWLSAYFEILGQRRIRIQRTYVQEKISPGFSSPVTMNNAYLVFSYFSGVAAVVLAVLSAYMVGKGEDYAHLAALCVSALASIGVLNIYAKIVSDGFQFAQEAERYTEYRDKIDGIEGEFNNADPSTKLNCLRRFEGASYDELRLFLKSNYEKNFAIS